MSTTSTAPEPPAPRAFVEATLFAAALEPLAAGLGFMGEIVVGAVARDLFLPPQGNRDGRA